MQTACTVKFKISSDYAEEIINIKEAGFDNVSLDVELQNFEEDSIIFNGSLNSMFLKLRKNNVNPILTKAIFSEDYKNNAYLTLVKESIKICSKSNCKYLAVSLLNEQLDESLNFYRSLISCIRENNITILLENKCNDINGHFVRNDFSEPGKLNEFIDRLNKAAGYEAFGLIMDVGASNLCVQDMYDFIIKLNNKIKVVRLRDNNGHDEENLLPFISSYKGVSKTDWLSLIRGLRKIEFDGAFILDSSDTFHSFSPLLRPTLLKLGKEICDYFVWQIGLENLLKKYDSVVLFGAGNMFKNYMEVYGEKYPPLFTCDNNEKLWGSKILGIEVKSPEALKNISEKCGVFICNSYYSEIKQQLVEMNIRNIELFNDEFLSAYPIDNIGGRNE